MLDFAEVIGAVTGRPVEPVLAPPRPGELQRSALAVDRARQDLGWVPVTALADGVRAVCQWIEAGTPDRADLQGSIDQHGRSETENNSQRYFVWKAHSPSIYSSAHT